MSDIYRYIIKFKVWGGVDFGLFFLEEILLVCGKGVVKVCLL